MKFHQDLRPCWWIITEPGFFLISCVFSKQKRSDQKEQAFDLADVINLINIHLIVDIQHDLLASVSFARHYVIRSNTSKFLRNCTVWTPETFGCRNQSMDGLTDIIYRQTSTICRVLHLGTMVLSLLAACYMHVHIWLTLKPFEFTWQSRWAWVILQDFVLQWCFLCRISMELAIKLRDGSRRMEKLQ